VAAPSAVSTTIERLLALLADGAQHSGEELAARLGVTRATVWNAVGELRAKGVEVISIDRRGYRLPERVELLDLKTLRRAAPAGAALPDDIEIGFELDSTNSRLFDAAAASTPRVLFAELQTAGRGRRGRQWIAPFGSGLTFSIAWSYPETPADLQALTLAIGVAVANALHEIGAADVALKWPNDLVTPRGKLGGLLTQLRHEPGGPVYVVTGLGMNLRLPDRSRAQIDVIGGLVPTDLAASLDAPPGRNALGALLVVRMIEALRRFGSAGFAPFVDDWARIDALAGQRVRVQQGDRWIDGVARGVDRDGALLIDSAGEQMRVYSGDVSVRVDGAAQ